MSRLVPRLLMVAGTALAFAAGHKAARSSAAQGDRDDGSRKRVTTGVQRHARGSTGRNAAGPRPWEKVKQRIVRRWEASPGVSVDFELREETMTVLEGVPAADLEDWMRTLQPTRWTDDDKDVPFQLRGMILMVLARREGAALMRSLVAAPTEEGYDDVIQALGQWTKHDPAAALEWLEGEVPEEIARRLDMYRKDALEHLSGKDSAEFERRLAMEDADTRKELLEDCAQRAGGAEGRAGLLAMAARSSHGEAMAIWAGLLGREGTEDPARAYATLAELDLSPEDRAELDEGLVFQLLYPALWSPEEIGGGGVMQAWIERNPGESVPGSILRSFGRWSESAPERAAAWVAEQPAGPRHEAFGKALVEERVEDHETFAGKVARIGDTTLRAAMLRRLKDSWDEKDSDAAAEWMQSLPEADRERLE